MTFRQTLIAILSVEVMGVFSKLSNAQIILAGMLGVSATHSCVVFWRETKVVADVERIMAGR